MYAEVWPFLISRNCRVDYTAVLVPDALAGTGEFDPVLRAVKITRNPAESEIQQTARVDESTIGPLTVVYRCRYAAEGDEKLRDCAGRPIVTASGVVVGGFVTDESLPEVEIGTANEIVGQAYARFWATDRFERPFFANRLRCL